MSAWIVYSNLLAPQFHGVVSVHVGEKQVSPVAVMVLFDVEVWVLFSTPVPVSS